MKICNQRCAVYASDRQTVKLAAHNLLKRLKEEKPTVLLHDWHKDTQTRLQVRSAIEQVLDCDLPPSYDLQFKMQGDL